jgi:hypothetical protein
MHDFLTGQTFTGNYDLPSHGVLVLDETVAAGERTPASGTAGEAQPAPEEKVDEGTAVPA